MAQAPRARTRLHAMLGSPWLHRGVISAALLGAVALWVDPRAIVDEVQRFSIGWVVLAFVISTLQIMLSAWRWQFTAGLISVPLRFGYALREYYLALLVNQLLPGGVLGDAGRAHRHARQAQSRGKAWRAVIIERASGQLALVLLTLTALLFSPLWHAALGMPVITVVGFSIVIGLALAIVGGLLLGHRFSAWSRRLPDWSQALARDIKRGLLQRGVWPRQLLSSLMIVLSYGLVMVCAARAIGVELPVLQLLALTPVLLLAMVIPFSVAGWGLREGAAAGVWALVGLPAAQGVAVSLAYGVLVLLASLPGIWVALSRREKASPSGSSLAKQHIEQGVLTAAEGSRGRTQRFIKRVDGRHFQSRPAGANQQGGDEQMQAVNGVRFDELRNRNAATFHQHAMQASLGQQCNDILRVELAASVQRQHAALNVGMKRRCWHLRPHNMQRRCGIGLHQGQAAGYPPARVQHDAGRVLAANVTHGQLRVVGTGSARADYHSVDHGAQPMQMHQAFMSVDVVRMTAFRCDAAIKALAQLSDNPLRLAGQRRQAVQQLAGLRANGQRRSPLAVRRELNHHRAGAMVAQRQQPLPGISRLNTAILMDGWRGSALVDVGIGHDASVLKSPLNHAGAAWLRASTSSQHFAASSAQRKL